MLNEIRKIAASCSCGRKHGLLTDTVQIGRGAADALAAYVKKRGFSAVLIVCDDNTAPYAARLASLLSNASTLTLPGDSHADEKGVKPLCGRLEAKPSADLLIAVGSGSLHDITRYSADRFDLPFIACPTAASVDGFVSSVAAMTWGGQKLSSPARAPIALFADESFYCGAPARLTASGAGDILGKYISLLDWKAAHILTDEAICPEIVGLVERALTKMEALLEAIASGMMKADSPEYVTLVMECLVLSGLAMQLQGNSRPASASEHHLSHLWEMHVINDPVGALHGEQVGVAALLLCRLLHESLADGTLKARLMKPVDPAATFDRALLEPVFGPMTDGILAENLTDGDPSTSPLVFTPSEEKADAVCALVSNLLPPETVERYLTLAGAPTTLSALGLPDDEAFTARTLAFAPYVRRRLTLLKILSAK